MNKRREYVYSQKEIVEIIQLTKALVSALRLPGFEDVVPPQVPKTAPPQRAYVPVGTRAGDRYSAPSRLEGLGNCGDCDSEMQPSKYPGGPPWCYTCWAAKRDGR